jgi:diguanylate cyclase (GGDEF)-like protein
VSDRPTLGLLVDSLEEAYQNAVLAGVAAAAIEHDANLLCFAGGVLRSPHRFGAQRNAIYEIAGPENIDGLLVMSGTLGNHVGISELVRFCERFRPLPMCSIAVALPGVSSVLVDNATGMKDAIVHLLEAHGHRRIAFIRGPEANEEAERRYRVYRDVLAERGVPLDPQLIAVGHFQQESGKAAVDVLFGQRGQLPQAIVAASDSMALGAIEGLAARGLRVPDDVAVVGFDDVEEARYVSPPLTTVRQPLEEQGRRAAELLLGKIAGRPTPEQVVLHTELVTRSSCGCPRGVPKAEDLSLLDDVIRSQAEQRLNVQRWARALAETGEALLTTFDVSLLARVAAEQFPQLGIESCFLSLYRGDHPPFERSRLVLAWERQGKQPAAHAGSRSFASRQLAPAGTLPLSRRHTFVVEPLFFKTDQLGFALFEMGPPEGVIYEALRDQISGALKGALLVQEVVEKDRERQRLLRYIVDVTPDMHRVQPLEDLFGNILGQVTGLLGAAPSAPAPTGSGSIPPPPEAEGFLGMIEEDGELEIKASTPHFAGQKRLEGALDARGIERVTEALGSGRIQIDVVSTIVPLRVGETTLGLIYLDRPAVSNQDVELLEIFSNQATAAIQNMQFYEMAALDPLTGVHARRFFEQWLRREVKTALRSQQPVSLIMLDMDGMKLINDTAGHLVGDQALSTVGKVLRQACRENDVIGRYGGDEFAVVLPQTGSEGAQMVALRILELLDDKQVAGLPIRSSLGVSTLTPHRFAQGELAQRVSARYFHDVATSVIGRADEALYEAKKRGGGRLCVGAATSWLPPSN